MIPSYTPNLIIGAGPAGLAIAGWLRSMDLPFEVLEKSDKISYSWHNHYDRLCLHTVKQLSHLPHMPFPDDYPLYVPREKLVQYYEAYAEEFRIFPHYNSELISLKRQGNEWIATTQDETSIRADNVILATGVNRVPYEPTWPGQESFHGEISHCRHYKNPLPFQGKQVLIVGFGNTGAEIALDLSENNLQPAISVRGEINVVPRDLNGRPVQLTARKLAKLPFGMGEKIGTMIRKRYFGDLGKYGLRVSKLSPTQQLMETGKTPVIDLGTIDHIKKGRIKIYPDIKRFVENGVEFVDGEIERFDAVLLATGYRPQLESFMDSTENLLDKYGCPQSPIGSGSYQNLYFLGFDNYKLGGILGTIFADSELIATTIRDRLNEQNLQERASQG